MASTRFAVVCAYCKRVQDALGQWQDVPIPTEIRITRGICPECDKEKREELER